MPVRLREAAGEHGGGGDGAEELGGAAQHGCCGGLAASSAGLGAPEGLGFFPSFLRMALTSIVGSGIKGLEWTVPWRKT